MLYQLVHGLALLALSVWHRQISGDKLLNAAAVSFTIGVLLFSGSIYLLALDGPPWLGPVTPVGGVAMILGWALLMAASMRQSRRA